MAKLIDLTGKRFGRWLVLKHCGVKGSQQLWECKCDCGTQRTIIGGPLKNGQSKSCGCYSRERSTTHGKFGTKTHVVWAQMLTRCLNKKHRAYKNYGGRGITVCDEWRSFENFYKDMGEKPNDLSLDRINNDKGYNKDNCRWATRETQSRNRRNTVKVLWNGNYIPLYEVVEISGKSYKSVYRKLRRGKTIYEALEK